MKVYFRRNHFQCQQSPPSPGSSEEQAMRLIIACNAPTHAEKKSFGDIIQIYFDRDLLDYHANFFFEFQSWNIVKVVNKMHALNINNRFLGSIVYTLGNVIVIKHNKFE